MNKKVKGHGFSFCSGFLGSQNTNLDPKERLKKYISTKIISFCNILLTKQILKGKKDFDH